MPNIQDCELSPTRTALVGRFSGSRKVAASGLDTDSEIRFDGDEVFSNYVRNFKPQIAVKGKLQEIEPDGSVKRVTRNLRVNFGGRLLGSEAKNVEDEYEEMYDSFQLQQMAANAVGDNGEYALVRAALRSAAIEEITDPNWEMAKDLGTKQGRDAISEELSKSKDDEVFLTSDLAIVPSVPAIRTSFVHVEGVSAELGMAELKTMYHEEFQALLAVAPRAGEDYVKYLRTLQKEIHDDLERFAATLTEESSELARNWLALGLIHSSTESRDCVRLLDIEGEWLVPPNFEDKEGRYGPTKNDPVTGITRQKREFLDLIVASNKIDQTHAVSSVVLLDPVEHPFALEDIGHWAQDEKVLVYVNLAQTEPKKLGMMAQKLKDKSADSWLQSVAVFGNFFEIPHGKSKIDLPAVVPVVARQRVQDTCLAAEKDPVGEFAKMLTGYSMRLVDVQSGRERMTKILQARRLSLKILDSDDKIQSTTKNMLNIPIVDDGGSSIRLDQFKTGFRSPKLDSGIRSFEDIAPVRIRNWVERTIHLHLRRHYRKQVFDANSEKQLRSELTQWMNTLGGKDFKKDQRRLIDLEESSVELTVDENSRSLSVQVSLRFPTVIEDTGVRAKVSEILNYKKVGDLWEPA